MITRARAAYSPSLGFMCHSQSLGELCLRTSCIYVITNEPMTATVANSLQHVQSPVDAASQQLTRAKFRLVRRPILCNIPE